MTSAVATATGIDSRLKLQLDVWILAPSLALLVIGYIAITSASVEYAAVNYGDPFYHSNRHLMYLLLALAAASMVLLVPTQFWFNTGWVWLFVGLVLLALVLIPGVGLIDVFESPSQSSRTDSLRVIIGITFRRITRP